MKSTKIVNLVIAAAVAFALTFVANKFVVANGGTIALIPPSLDISLLAAAVIELLIAVPIFRFRRDVLNFAKNKNAQRQIRRVDSFYAVRVLALAKATSVFGSLFFGYALALVLAQSLLPIIPDAIIKNIVAAFVSVVLVVVSLLIERACKLPKSDETPADPQAETNPA
ncbi:MAG: hypothetical protein RLZZ164_261 [Actinomycetota bacterium]